MGGITLNELPEGWSLTGFMDVFDLQGGTQPPKSSFKYEPQPGYIQLLQIRDFGERSVPTYVPNLDTLKKCNEQDILIARYGASLGRILTGFSGAYNVAMAKVDIPDEIYNRFAYHLLRSEIFQAPLRSISRSAQSGFNKQDITKIEIPIPPFNEQKRIADKLDKLFTRIDACCDRLARIPQILEKFRQNVLDDAISGYLTEDWRQSENTDSWLYENAENICNTVQNGGTPKEGFIEEPGIPFLKVYNLVNQKIYFEYRPQFISENIHKGKLSKSCARPWDVLMNIVGPPLGKVAIVPTSFAEWNINQAITLFRPSERITTNWLYYFFCSGSSVAEIFNETRGSAGQRNISLSQCRNFSISVPPIKEQEEIVRRIEKLFSHADLVESHYLNALEKIEELKSLILEQAFRGELVSPDPNDEPASTLIERIKAEKIRIKSERTSTIRKITKDMPKFPVCESLNDYVEVIRSAFTSLEDKANARKLFDQSELKPEEVISFYEALREIPEIRTAFENSRQEPLSQEPVLTPSSSKDQVSETGRFRLIKLWLEDFKNLIDYTVDFNPSHNIDIFLGWNGTGKSNLFEALVIIFRDLSEWSKSKSSSRYKTLMKGYHLLYEINEQIVDISWYPREMKSPTLKWRNSQEDNQDTEIFVKISKGELPFPRFIFGYYSGPTNRLAEHFLPMNQNHYKRLLNTKSDDPETLSQLLEERRFFCAENHHAKYVLLAFFHKEDDLINKFLKDRLRIIQFESALFIIRKPDWAKKGQTAESFWGADGVMLRVLERLQRFAIAPMVLKQKIREGYRSTDQEHYYFFLPDLKSLHAFASEYQNARTFFLALESIDFSELIYDLKIQVRVQATQTEEVAITFHELSEGEQQLLMVLGLMRFTKSHQSLVLLDEPDTHLNPHWSVDYLKLLTRIMSESTSESEEQQTSQILMSTHDPLVIASLLKEQIYLLKRDWQTGICKWEQPSVNPRGLGFTGILTSEMFGMRSDLDEKTLADLDTKVRLIASEDSLTPEEVIELEKINKRLEDAGFQKAFSDPYYAAFIRAWSHRYKSNFNGERFINPEEQKNIDRIASDILKEVMAELQAEALS